MPRWCSTPAKVAVATANNRWRVASLIAELLGLSLVMMSRSSGIVIPSCGTMAAALVGLVLY